jgi:hypothetical protein
VEEELAEPLVEDELVDEGEVAVPVDDPVDDPLVDEPEPAEGEETVPVAEGAAPLAVLSVPRQLVEEPG